MLMKKSNKLTKLKFGTSSWRLWKSRKIHEHWSLGPPRDVDEKVEKVMKIEVWDLLVMFMNKLKNWWKMKFGTSSWHLWKSQKMKNIEVRDFLVMFMNKSKTLDEYWSSWPPRDVYEKVDKLMTIEVCDLLVTFMKKSNLWWKLKFVTSSWRLWKRQKIWTPVWPPIKSDGKSRGDT